MDCFSSKYVNHENLCNEDESGAEQMNQIHVFLVLISDNLDKEIRCAQQKNHKKSIMNENRKRNQKRVES